MLHRFRDDGPSGGVTPLFSQIYNLSPHSGATVPHGTNVNFAFHWSGGGCCGERVIILATTNQSLPPSQWSQIGQTYECTINCGIGDASISWTSAVPITNLYWRAASDDRNVLAVPFTISFT